MRKTRHILIFLFSVSSVTSAMVHAQTTHNLEVIFRYTWPDTFNADEKFGISISSAGDVNGDSIDDVIVGSPPRFWVGAQDTSPGRAYVFLGGSSMDTIPDVILAGEYPEDLFGNAVADGGDLNGDGYGDVVVGAPNGTLTDSCGRAYVYFGGDPMDSVPDLILKGAWCSAFGGAVGYAGDVNGDSWDDLAVGAYATNGFNGRVYVYFGGPGLDTLADVFLSGSNSEGLGMSVGGGGDVNSDGFDDIVVGAPDNDEVHGNGGKIYLYLGGDPMDTTPDVWMHGEGTEQFLGWFNVSILEDTSGYDWVLAGTPLWPNGFGARNNGKAYVLFGGDPMDTVPDVELTGQTDSSALGMWSSGGGVVNPDGFEEVLSGSPADAEHTGGASYLWLSGPSMDTIPDAWLAGRWPRDLVGYQVASAGDVNGDGCAEVMVSNYPADTLDAVWICRYTGTGVEETSPVRSGKVALRLMQNVPNPFVDMTLIRYATGTLGAESRQPHRVSLRIYDIAGRLVRSLVDETQEPSRHAVWWEGRDSSGRVLPGGIYFCRLEACGSAAVRKIVLVRQ